MSAPRPAPTPECERCGIAAVIERDQEPLCEACFMKVEADAEITASIWESGSYVEDQEPVYWNDFYMHGRRER